MATANAAATLKRAQDIAASLVGATVQIRAGSTVLATHTIATFTGSNSGANGLVTANGLPNNATIAATGTADNAILAQGTKEYALTLGTSGSGSDIIVSTTNYITGETSTLNSLVITVLA